VESASTYFDHHLSGNYVRPVAPKVLQLLYQAFVLPIFDYSNTVWSTFCCSIHNSFKVCIVIAISNNNDSKMNVANPGRM